MVDFLSRQTQDLMVEHDFYCRFKTPKPNLVFTCGPEEDIS